MNRSTGFQNTLPDFPAKRLEDKLSNWPLGAWKPPTFAEFVRQIEHEFGDTVDLSSLPLGRADRDRLTPSSVRSLCEQLGLPPEDFGV